MKIIGFNQGQFGDLCINTIAARAIKQQIPDSHLTFSINKKYKDISELFKHNALIDDMHIWDGYDEWPTQVDKMFLEQHKFDKVFHPMAKHVDSQWYLHRHQTEEVCVMHGLTPPDDLSVKLTRYFNTTQGQYITVCLTGDTRGDEKSFTYERAKEICSYLEKYLNIPVVQIGAPTSKKYATHQFIGNFLESTKIVLESKLLITVDTCWAWIASGYSMHTLGIYNYNYYKPSLTAKNWQPINSNACYIDLNSMNNITAEQMYIYASKLL